MSIINQFKSILLDIKIRIYQVISNIWHRKYEKGEVHWGDLRRLTPISRVFGLDRGMPLDRYYIEGFIRNHCEDISGRVLEVGSPEYIMKFGGDRVTKIDVLHIVSGNPQATIVGDFVTGKGIPRSVFDCIILTQTLLVTYDVRAAVANCYAALKPGGVLLATIPGISQISRYDMDRWGDYWRFTTLSSRRLFEEVFPAANVSVKSCGNVLVSVAFLHGLAVGELKQHELNFYDPDYEVLITVRAVKPLEEGS